ncbi:MAG: hypothetical protein IJ480_01845 [Clostridia bacterium]|nr:hypothetical protein [Clostridia bacterium]
MRICIDPTPKHTISPYLFMQFAEPLGTADASVDAGWDALNNCWHQKLIEKIRELGPTMIRWGGCFASYYHWREAVGPRESRIPMHNLCWDGIYHNQVGTAEVAELCRLVDAEPLMVVNMESDGRMHWAYPKPGMDRLGTAEEAAAWVRYANDQDDALRLAHGVKTPYNIRWWQIGNETSYDRRGFDCETAAVKTLEFARAMREADPDIHLLAWGDSGWAPRMCEVLGDTVDYIAFHHHFGAGDADSPLYGTEYRRDPALTWRYLMTHACQSLEKQIAKMRQEAAPYGKRLAMTEGHYTLNGRNRCEVLSSWGAGVSYARCLSVIEQASDILDIATLADFFGNRWQVNALMLPAPIRDGNAYLQPVGEVMKLFRHHIGSHALKYTVSETPGDPVDVNASLSPDGKKVYLHLVNTSRTGSCEVELEIPGSAAEGITAYEIAHDMAEEITPLTPDLFLPVERKITGRKYTLPAAAVTALEISLDSSAGA